MVVDLKTGGKFIYVCDEVKKKELEVAGYKLIRKADKFWIFLNKEREGVAFTHNDNVVINNILTF